MTSLTRNSNKYIEGFFFFLFQILNLCWLQLIFILWPPFVCIVLEEEKEKEKNNKMKQNSAHTREFSAEWHNLYSSLSYGQPAQPASKIK